MPAVSVTVTDANNIALTVTPPATYAVTVDRGAPGPAGPISKSITILAPLPGDSITLYYTTIGGTISTIESVAQGTSAAATFRVWHGTSRASGTSVVTAGIVCNSATTGITTTVFDNPVVPPESFIWLEVVSLSGSVDQFHATIFM